MNRRRLERLLTSLHHTDGSGTSVLQRICVVCAASSGDGAGISRITSGRHEPLAASDHQAQRIEQLQVELAEGPCIEVFDSLQPFIEPDLSSGRARDRWPNFAPLAIEEGVGAVFAFPLLAGGVAVGALDVYSRRPGELDDAEFDDALMLADLAALSVRYVDQSPNIPEVGLVAEPSAPWAHPALVHNASGMVSELLQVDVDEALLRLRALAFARETPLVDVAREVVERRLQVERWPDRE